MVLGPSVVLGCTTNEANGGRLLLYSGRWNALFEVVSKFTALDAGACAEAVALTT